jgi:hypothetical protein
LNNGERDSLSYKFDDKDGLTSSERYTSTGDLKRKFKIFYNENRQIKKIIWVEGLNRQKQDSKTDTNFFIKDASTTFFDIQNKQNEQDRTKIYEYTYNKEGNLASERQSDGYGKEIVNSNLIYDSRGKLKKENLFSEGIPSKYIYIYVTNHTTKCLEKIYMFYTEKQGKKWHTLEEQVYDVKNGKWKGIFSK